MEGVLDEELLLLVGVAVVLVVAEDLEEVTLENDSFDDDLDGTFGIEDEVGGVVVGLHVELERDLAAVCLD